jgi:hypothetical protein
MYVTPYAIQLAAGVPQRLGQLPGPARDELRQGLEAMAGSARPLGEPVDALHRCLRLSHCWVMYEINPFARVIWVTAVGAAEPAPAR